MTWICPYCGYENLRDPLNSRDKPGCGGCNERYTTPEDALEQIQAQIDDYEGIIKGQNIILTHAREMVESLKSELGEMQMGYDNAAKEVKESQTELDKLRNFKIYFRMDKEAKARKDKKQKRIVGVMATSMDYIITEEQLLQLQLEFGMDDVLNLTRCANIRSNKLSEHDKQVQQAEREKVATD